MNESIQVEKLLNRFREESGVAKRFVAVLQHWTGLPYTEGPLASGPQEPEEKPVQLSGFDCVTLIESALAAARSEAAGDFFQELNQLRYHGGKVSWMTRNHYMSDWIERNVERGVLTIPEYSCQKEGCSRTLSCLEDYPPREKAFDFLPASQSELLLQESKRGDIVCFVSVRPDLDVFHVGVLDGNDLIHSSRSLGGVRREPLSQFLNRNETKGFLTARTTEAPR